ncbi:MAG: PLP-dependent decarboxylase [Gammaproteobacteria bacterium]|nr:PLP-dependent decarboxylase [Gammaproteobacteria bacterium]
MGGNHSNFSDQGLQLSRGLRVLKIWMSVQTFGLKAFLKAISRSMSLAARAGGVCPEKLHSATTVSGVYRDRVFPCQSRRCFDGRESTT